MEKSDGDRMTGSVDWKEAIELIAGPRAWNDTREGWLARATRRAGISYRQAKALFYRECVDPRDSVARSVRSAAAKAQQEAADLALRFEQLAGSLDAADENFYRADVAALIDAARALRSVVGPGNRGTKVSERK